VLAIFGVVAVTVVNMELAPVDSLLYVQADDWHDARESLNLTFQVFARILGLEITQKIQKISMERHIHQNKTNSNDAYQVLY